MGSVEKGAPVGLLNHEDDGGDFHLPDEFWGRPDDLFDFADAASENPAFYADVTDPQSLNRYQYCYNNPLRFTDIDGHRSRTRPRGIQPPAPLLVPQLSPEAVNAIIKFFNTAGDVVADDAKAIGSAGLATLTEER